MPRPKLRGRKRVLGHRTPNGQLVRQQSEAIPLQALDRRADLVGEQNVKSQAASTAFGVLRLRDIVTETQYQAGLRFEQVHRRWAAMAGAKPHTAQCGERDGGLRPDVTGEEWAVSKRRYFDARDALSKCPAHRLVWAGLETIILDDFLPPQFLAGNVPQAAKDAVINGLNALARLYGLTDDGAVKAA